MTVEELKVEAEKLGYRIVKNDYVKRKPCPRCGSTRVPHTNCWSICPDDRVDKYGLWKIAYPHYSLTCKDCGFTSKFVGGRRRTTEYVRMWNEGIEETEINVQELLKEYENEA